MEAGVTIVPITDMRRAVAFYQDVLGMEVKQRFGGLMAIMADKGQARLWLFNAQRAGIDWPPRDDHPTFVFFTDDFQRDYRRFEELGIPMRNLEEDPLGHIVMFQDSEGNLLELRQLKDEYK